MKKLFIIMLSTLLIAGTSSSHAVLSEDNPGQLKKQARVEVTSMQSASGGEVKVQTASGKVKTASGEVKQNKVNAQESASGAKIKNTNAQDRLDAAREKQADKKEELKEKLKKALMNRFKAVDKMENEKQIEVYSKIVDKIASMKEKGTYTGSKGALLILLEEIFVDKLALLIDGGTDTDVDADAADAEDAEEEAATGTTTTE